MSEYETASLALQELSIWATVGVGLLHAVLIGCGLWMMLRASSDRNRAMDEDRRVADQRHDEARQRHEEAQQRHEEAQQRHEEAQRRYEEEVLRRRDEAQQRHEEAMTALRALIERTAPPRPGPAG